MTVTQFKRTEQGQALLKLYDDFIAKVNKWTIEDWKSKGFRYVTWSKVFTLFWDKDYNTLDIPEQITADEIWLGVEDWYRHSEYVGEIFSIGDARWTQFEAAFERIINFENEEVDIND